jgi:hypothetical protein
MDEHGLLMLTSTQGGRNEGKLAHFPRTMHQTKIPMTITIMDDGGDGNCGSNTPGKPNTVVSSFQVGPSIKVDHVKQAASD